MTNLPLFDGPKVKASDPIFDHRAAFGQIGAAARRDGPRTSKRTALEVAARMGGLRKWVVDFLHSRGEHGATAFETSEARKAFQKGDTIHAISPRFAELSGEKRTWPYRFIRDSGRTRKTGAGHEAIVWIALDVPEDVDPSEYPEPCPHCGGTGLKDS